MSSGFAANALSTSSKARECSCSGFASASGRPQHLRYLCPIFQQCWQSSYHHESSSGQCCKCCRSFFLFRQLLFLFFCFGAFWPSNLFLGRVVGLHLSFWLWSFRWAWHSQHWATACNCLRPRISTEKGRIFVRLIHCAWFARCSFQEICHLLHHTGLQIDGVEEMRLWLRQNPFWMNYIFHYSPAKPRRIMQLGRNLKLNGHRRPQTKMTRRNSGTVRLVNVSVTTYACQKCQKLFLHKCSGAMWGASVDSLELLPASWNDRFVTRMHISLLKGVKKWAATSKSDFATTRLSLSHVQLVLFLDALVPEAIATHHHAGRVWAKPP